MEAALGWLGTIFEFLLNLFPRLFIVNANEGGIKYPKGSGIVELKPGLHWWWPLLTNPPVKISTVRQTHNLASQTLTTADDYPAVVSVVVIYQIVDVVKALNDTHDFEDTIGDSALKASVATVCSREFESVRDGLTTGEVQQEIRARCRKALKPYGVRVLDCFVTDFVWTYSLSHKVDGSSPSFIQA